MSYYKKSYYMTMVKTMEDKDVKPHYFSKVNFLCRPKSDCHSNLLKVCKPGSIPKYSCYLCTGLKAIQ